MSSTSGKRKKSGGGKKSQQAIQHEGNKSATINGTQTKKPSTPPATEEKPNTEKQVEQTISESKPQKITSDDKVCYSR